MPVDNRLYDRLAGTWWSEDSFLSLLRTVVNPARFGYMRKVLLDRLQIDPAGKAALDIGCGGGLLAEEFARLGCRVTGIDPSPQSLDQAREHAERAGLEIEYLTASGEQLPFEDGSFEIAYCCDVLEHVDDLERVVSETARVLKPGGVFMYDTINRTLASRLVLIKLWQEWKATAFVDPGLHDWDMFIKPAELIDAMARAGLENRDVQGIGLGANPLAMLATMRKRARGKIGYGELGRRLVLRESWDRSQLYAGFAVKRV